MAQAQAGYQPLIFGPRCLRGVPLCGCQRYFGVRRAVERPITQHGEQNVTAPPCERDEGLIVALSLADFAGVIGSGDRVAQSGEGRQEPGAARHRRQACVGSQMSCGSEGAAHHIDQESGCGPDADSRHAGQDRMKRVRKHKAFDFLGHFFSLFAQSRELSRQPRQDS